MPLIGLDFHMKGFAVVTKDENGVALPNKWGGAYDYSPMWIPGNSPKRIFRVNGEELGYLAPTDVAVNFIEPPQKSGNYYTFYNPFVYCETKGTIYYDIIHERKTKKFFYTQLVVDFDVTYRSNPDDEGVSFNISKVIEVNLDENYPYVKFYDNPNIVQFFIEFGISLTRFFEIKLNFFFADDAYNYFYFHPLLLPLANVTALCNNRGIANPSDYGYAEFLKLGGWDVLLNEVLGTFSKYAVMQYEYNSNPGFDKETSALVFKYPYRIDTLQSPNGYFTIRDYVADLQHDEDGTHEFWVSSILERLLFWSGFKASILYPQEIPPAHYIAVDDFGFHSIFSMRPVSLLTSHSVTHGIALIAHTHKEWMLFFLKPHTFYFQPFKAFIDYNQSTFCFRSDESVFFLPFPFVTYTTFYTVNDQIHKFVSPILRFSHVGWYDYLTLWGEKRGAFPRGSLPLLYNSHPYAPNIYTTIYPLPTSEGGKEGGESERE